MLSRYAVAPVAWIDENSTAAEIDSWLVSPTRLRWGLNLPDDEKARSGALHPAILESYLLDIRQHWRATLHVDGDLKYHI